MRILGKIWSPIKRVATAREQSPMVLAVFMLSAAVLFFIAYLIGR